MKKLVTLVGGLVLAFALVAVPTVRAQTAGPLQGFVAAFNAYDSAAVLETVTDDFLWTFTRGGGEGDDGIVHKSDLTGDFASALSKEHSKIELTDVLTEDRKITFTFAWHFDSIEKLELGPIVGKGVAEVRDGKLHALTLIFDPAIIDRFTKAMAGETQPMPQTGSDLKDFRLLGLAGLGALLILGGFGLRRRSRLDS